MMGDLFLEWEDLAQATTMFADFFVCRLRFGMRPPPLLSSNPQQPDRIALLQIPDSWGNTHSFFRFSKLGGHLGP